MADPFLVKHTYTSNEVLYLCSYGVLILTKNGSVKKWIKPRKGASYLPNKRKDSKLILEKVRYQNRAADLIP